MQAIHAGSALTFSPREVERHLQHAEEECRIMRSRGNIYFCMSVCKNELRTYGTQML